VEISDSAMKSNSIGNSIGNVISDIHKLVNGLTMPDNKLIDNMNSSAILSGIKKSMDIKHRCQYNIRCQYLIIFLVV
jgi:hypothetical protein